MDPGVLLLHRPLVDLAPPFGTISAGRRWRCPRPRRNSEAHPPTKRSSRSVTAWFRQCEESDHADIGPARSGATDIAGGTRVARGGWNPGCHARRDRLVSWDGWTSASKPSNRHAVSGGSPEHERFANTVGASYRKCVRLHVVAAFGPIYRAADGRRHAAATSIFRSADGTIALV